MNIYQVAAEMSDAAVVALILTCVISIPLNVYLFGRMVFWHRQALDFGYKHDEI